MSTIAAISTAAGNAGIGIIRMSGEKCFEILEKIFIPKKQEEIKGYTIKYGNIVNSKTKEIIDEVLVSYFIKPNSYTRENMCEINSHGGIIVEKIILEECIKNGAILAEPGEFTKRAFLNGRIDLTQAEAVIDVINAKTEKEAKASERQLQGRLSRKLEEIEKELLDIMADVEASIDYPEYDVEEVTNNKMKNTLKSVEDKIIKLEKSFENGKIIKNGIKTCIIGKPNVGKSSLLNLLLKEDRAIVSNIEGTTRDTIEEVINFNGIPLKLIDTAGIRNTNDEIEKIGVKKSLNIINDADLIICVFDDSRKLDEEDRKIINLIKDKKAIVLINKVDLDKNYVKKDKEILELGEKVIEFSTYTEQGLEELYSEISRMFNLENIEVDNSEIITNIRQKEHIINAHKALKESLENIENNMPIDICSIYIKQILEEIGHITGKNISEEIINEIFSKFCLGK